MTKLSKEAEIDLLLKTRPYNEQDGKLHTNPFYEDDPVQGKPDELVTDRLDYKGFDFCLYRMPSKAVYAVRLLPTDATKIATTPAQRQLSLKDVCIHSEHGYRFWQDEDELRAALAAGTVYLDVD